MGEPSKEFAEKPTEASGGDEDSDAGDAGAPAQKRALLLTVAQRILLSVFMLEGQPHASLSWSGTSGGTFYSVGPSGSGGPSSRGDSSHGDASHGDASHGGLGGGGVPSGGPSSGPSSGPSGDPSGDGDGGGRAPYFERQSLAREGNECARHAANMLAGRKNMFTVQDFADAARELQAQAAKDLGPEQAAEQKPYISGAYNAGRETLERVLAKKGYTFQDVDLRPGQDARTDIERKLLGENQKSFFVNSKQRNHWWALLEVDGQWYDLDSLKNGPEKIESPVDYYIAVQQTLSRNDITMFASARTPAAVRSSSFLEYKSPQPGTATLTANSEFLFGPQGYLTLTLSLFLADELETAAVRARKDLKEGFDAKDPLFGPELITQLASGAVLRDVLEVMDSRTAQHVRRALEGTDLPPGARGERPRQGDAAGR